MSLITRCPACGTMFNVVADQLKVSQGWVRCGQCADVFDASLHLQHESTPPDLQVPKFVEPESLPPSVALDNTVYASYAEEVVAALKTPDEKAPPAFNDLPSPVATSATDVKEPEPLDAQDDLPSELPAEISNDVSFVRDARRQALWRKPLVRVALSLTALLLICLLALQVAVMQRDSLAALEPRLKPVLQMLCERLACQVGPVRQIEAIVIDSSSFNKINDTGTYRLSVVLKNTGSMAVAMPSLEVTLTDTQDQPVLRRVLSPAQLGAANNMLATGTEFSGALNLQVAATTPSSDSALPPVLGRVAGYRLLAFYP